MSQSIEISVKNRIYGKGRGWVFTQKDFADLGSSDAIRKSLSRLEQEGFIRRLIAGLYDYPKKHNILGILPPDYDQIAKAIANRYNTKIQPSGSYAANLLGLSEQVPGKIIFLTDGPSKKIKIGNVELIFRKTTPRMMKMAGNISGLIVQALKYIGQNKVTPKQIEIIKNLISEDDKRRLSLDAKYAPVWISKLIKELVGE